MIDVIIPVYRGLPQTRRCIESALGSRQRADLELVVVDDASPDPEIVAFLDGLAGEGRVTLVRNGTNTGFVRSVNRGMAMHGGRDVVLLNSDAEVANDWLDRLRRSAYSQGDIGTATPFSNNATICSYPFDGWPGGVPGTLGLAALDRLVATANAGRTVDVPTGVGSCMYLRRACLDAIGLFDAERFGRGYGEENDFCLRAARAGWRNVLCGDVFVFHEGAASFSDERTARTTAAERALLEVHPDYLRRVRDFVRRDPAGELRDAIDAARAALGTVEAFHVLAERAAHRAQLAARLAEAEAFADDHAAPLAKLREGLAHAEALVAERDAALRGRDEEIAKLGGGLVHAEALVAERDAALRERDEEIAKLRSGLAHAEALVSERSAELDRIRQFWLGRFVDFLARRS